MEIIKTKDLTFTYSGSLIPTIKDVSVSINEGEFITICGSTGSGKSTFLKLLKNEISPRGNIEGKIYFQDKELDKLTSKDSASLIGYVMQRPEHQIVTDKVWHELAFGAENLNIPKNEISRQISEMASYFGIEDWFDKDVNELSGGQKQMLNLASVMVMNPKVLLLDEPTSQLDPISASEFVSTLKKLNQDLGTTIIIIEHRLEELISISDKILFFENGSIKYYDSPRIILDNISDNSELLKFMPIPSRFFKEVKGVGECPINVREGRNFLKNSIKNKYSNKSSNSVENSENRKNIALEFKNVFFRFNREQNDILSSLNLKVYENEIFCLLGGNGSGKSTLMSVASNLLKPYSGKVKVFEKKLKDYTNQSLYEEYLTLLPQDVQALLSEETVEEELKNNNYLPFDLTHLYHRHPYDLSAGEQQLVALMKILKNNPNILLLDEPTKGIDPITKNKIIDIIKSLKKDGKTVFIVTHDLEFAAECADRCGLLFRGNIVSVDNTNKFFTGNKFYTTVANKVSTGILSDVITLEELTDAYLKSVKRS